MKLNKETIYDIIFGIESPAGKRFDLILIWSIIISVFAITLDSIASINQQYGFII